MKTYLKNFDFPFAAKPETFGMTCFNNFYPYGVLGDLEHIEFEPVTILYGGNGSGKSTILNIIAEKLHIQRTTKFNKSGFFSDYVSECECDVDRKLPFAKIITSDDVFKNLFLLREKNEIIDYKREDAFDKLSYGMGTINDILGDVNLLDKTDEIKDIIDARQVAKGRKLKSSFVKDRVEKNLIGKSNGETAIDYFINQTQNAGLYLLDEPENSLSASYQVELANYLLDSARFFDAQLIIATHSPFILSIPHAKIYNLDTEPVSLVYDWTTLDNVRVYYEFFKKYADRFDK